MTVWDALRGSRAAEALALQFRTGEVAHAWLLLGPGKRRAALAMAAALNCTDAPGVGCGQCSVCRRTLLLRFPDVHQIVPEGPLIPVDVIREAVIPEAARSPFEGRVKVFLIDEAEKMNAAAQNALLKTLEEPTGDTVFVLTAEQEDDLLDTIRSRCRVFRLEAVPEDAIAAALVEEGAPPETARLAARLSHGEMERARRVAYDDATRQRRQLWLGIPARLASAVDALDAAAEVSAVAGFAVKEKERDHKAELKELDEILGSARGTAAARNAVVTRHKRELRRLEQEVLGEALETLASFYRDVVAVRVGSADQLINLDLGEQVEAWSRSGITNVALMRAAERCLATSGTLGLNANQALALEATFVALTSVVPAPSAVAVG